MMGSLFEFISSASPGISTDASLWDFGEETNQNKQQRYGVIALADLASWRLGYL